MTALEYVNGLNIEELNKVYNYLGDINDYGFDNYLIRKATDMNIWIGRLYHDFISLIDNNIDNHNFRCWDNYFYFDYETDELRSFSDLEDAPYTREDLARGLEAEVECRAFDTLEDIIDEIEVSDFA